MTLQTRVLLPPHQRELAAAANLVTDAKYDAMLVFLETHALIAALTDGRVKYERN